MAYAIGIDVGGTTIKAAVTSSTGAICDTWQTLTPSSEQELISSLQTIVERFHQRLAAKEIKDGETTVTSLLQTVGFDVPGIVNEKTGIAEFSANLNWKDFPAKARLESRLGTPVAFGHDVRSGALAESFWGVKLPDFFYIAIGTGIASTLILDKRIVAAHPWAGEIGQIPVFPEYRGIEGALRPAVLHQPLPLEQICSAAGITRRAVELGLVSESDGSAGVYALADKLPNPIDANEFLKAQKAQSIIDTALTTLAHAVAHFLAGVGPIPVVLGGGLANRGQQLLDHFQAELKVALGIVPAPSVHLAQLGSWSQVQGAALRAFIAEEVL
ncbi:ROK family protein [Gleimia sp. 6138-11-ORH1]|uniref:ROK family protein n=1 Tax=Gleimia sp. 6138-11-ORH1 TaxID=2973937 RepID=UPI002169A7C5|nr:ROK family protein [Gleimia sp. 6138-11-ORH1]MCS4484788.1 ROK family protein [Gleimia sp. 6138-11-ORH1]